MSVQPIPDGFHTITPYLLVNEAARLIDFMKQAFDAEEIHRSTLPDGSIMHAQLKIGDSMIMMGEATDEYKPMPAMIHLYVENMDKLYQRALDAGGTSVREPTNEFYGDRTAGVKDPCGNQWWISTHVEDVSPEEMARREAALRKQQ